MEKTPIINFAEKSLIIGGLAIFGASLAATPFLASYDIFCRGEATNTEIEAEVCNFVDDLLSLDR